MPPKVGSWVEIVRPLRSCPNRAPVKSHAPARAMTIPARNRIPTRSPRNTHAPSITNTGAKFASKVAFATEVR